jgi:hypothetical protein
MRGRREGEEGERRERGGRGERKVRLLRREDSMMKRKRKRG